MGDGDLGDGNATGDDIAMGDGIAMEEGELGDGITMGAKPW